MQDIVRAHHEHARLKLRLERERHMDRHLVAIEVRVEGRADEGMELDRLALDQHGLERLDAEAVQGRRAIEQHRMLADDLVQDVPDFRLLLFDKFLGLFDRRGQALGVEPCVNERLEQLQRHLLRQAALMQLQLGADHDDRTTRVVDALAEQVLPESTLLAFQHVGERLQRPLVGARDDAPAAAIVEQSIHRLLKHALLVADDDVRRAQLDQPLEAVIAVDDATIEIVQIRGREAAAVEGNEGPQIWRDHRNDGEDHPVGLVAGLQQRLDDLEALHQLFRLQLGGRDCDLLAEVHRDLLKIKLAQNLADRLGADHRRERVLAVFLLSANVLVLGQELTFLEGRQARLDDNVGLEIKDALQLLEGHVEQKTDPARQRLQEPDMRDGSREFDVPHAVAPHARERHLDAALLADDALVLHALVLAAQALVILDGPKDARAEQAVALGLEGAVVDGLRLLDLAVGPGQNLLRARNRDFDLIKALRLRGLIKEIHDLLVHRCLLIPAPS